MIKAVIFDAGGVLVDNPWPGMRTHYSQHLSVSEEEFEKVFPENLQDWHTGKISEDEFWKRMARSLKVTLPKSENVWITGLLGTYREKQEIYKFIKQIKADGYKTAILSNTEFPVVKLLTEKNYPHFDALIFSCEVGIAKPDAEIYIHTLEKLAIKPEEAIFIDDKKENIDAAEKLGIHGVLFDTADRVISSVSSLLRAN